MLKRVTIKTFQISSLAYQIIARCVFTIFVMPKTEIIGSLGMLITIEQELFIFSYRKLELQLEMTAIA